MVAQVGLRRSFGLLYAGGSGMESPTTLWIHLVAWPGEPAPGPVESVIGWKEFELR